MTKCNICGNTEQWHIENKPVHAFVSQGKDPGSATNKPKEEKPQLQTMKFGGDPVLRLALINKGILTVDDLTAAESVINVTRTTGTPVIAGSYSDSGSGSTDT